ncbi:MAG TPA: SEC-C metal-binding domain-containing protein [Mycobacteriales bacterium]
MAGGDLDGVARDLDAARSARTWDPARYAAALERAIGAFEEDAAAAGEVFELAELYDELWPEYESLGRVEDALAAADAAVAAGLRSAPDPRCLRAEILMRAGRIAEAEPIWAAVRADTPDDVWLYNNAGIEYAAAGEHETALAWLTHGLRLAMEGGDPERLVDQLADFRRASLAALGRQGDDELQQRAADFLEQQQHDAEVRRAAVAAWRAERERGHRPSTVVAWVWLPAEEYDAGLDAWPDLGEDELVNGPEGRLPHADYCRELQQRLVEAADAGISRTWIAPVRVEAFASWCAEHGETVGAEARAAYAADLAHRRDPTLVAWPPPRNGPCWCGSGRKYKKCCAAPR